MTDQESLCNTNIAFVYAGQGSQIPGMGHDLYHRFPVFKQAFDHVDPRGELRHLCFEAPMEELSRTSNTQPAMVAFATAATALLADIGIRPAMVAGLSLGEYAALACAGVFTPAQAVDLVRYRGRVMEQAVEGRPCSMAAILGLDTASVTHACQKASSYGIVEAANFNCPGQIVISGDAVAVQHAVSYALELGAKHTVALPVSGAFHTSLMKPAGDLLGKRFATESFGSMDIPVVFNATGRTIAAGQTVAGLLEYQVQNSVLFEASVRWMADTGIDTFVEIGPGKILSKFVRKIDRSLLTFNVEDVESFERTCAKLKELADE